MLNKLRLFHTSLLANLPALREKKGTIGCPSAYLNYLTITTRLECCHVCGVLFPEWMSANKFYEDGRKVSSGNCPCTSYGALTTKNTFWEYIDKVLIMGV